MPISARGIYQGALFSIMYATDSFRQNPHNYEFFVYIVIKRFFFLPCLFCFPHFQCYQFEKANYLFTILEARLSVFVQLLFIWLWRCRILMAFFAFTVHCKNFVLAPKLFECSPNFPSAPITRYTHSLKHEPVLE